MSIDDQNDDRKQFSNYTPLIVGELVVQLSGERRGGVITEVNVDNDPTKIRVAFIGDTVSTVVNAKTVRRL
jgi:hypothetical protein